MFYVKGVMLQLNQGLNTYSSAGHVSCRECSTNAEQFRVTLTKLFHCQGRETLILEYLAFKSVYCMLSKLTPLKLKEY